MISYVSYKREIYDDNSNKKYVLFSSDDNPDYYFLLPIAILAWRKIQYNPIINLVWDVRSILNSGIRYLVLDTCCKFGGTVYIIDSGIIKNDNRFDGYNLSMLSQISRFCSSSLFYSLQDYFLTSDADMIPVKKEWFHQQNKNKLIHLFYANGYHHTRYPICYIGMNINEWENLFDLTGMDIYSALVQLVKELQPNSRQDVQWGYDEILFYDKVSSYFSNYKDNCHMINRRIYLNPTFFGSKKDKQGIPRMLPYGRLDRSNWDLNSDKIIRCPEGLIDIHCMRKPYTEENWRHLFKALELVFNKEELKIISDYRVRFISYV